LIPKPTDGEVESFSLRTIEEVKSALARGEFVKTATMVYTAYLIRHGLLTAEMEPRIPELCARLHRKHDIFIWEDLVADLTGT
jgi:hypothetical protein